MSFVNEKQTKTIETRNDIIEPYFNPINEPLHPNRQLIFLKSHVDAI